MKQANHNRIVHLIISGIHFIWVKYGFYIGIHCLHQAIIIGLHDASWRAKLQSNDYHLLQHSKVKLIDICIHTLLRTWLVHIVIYSDHSWKIKWFLMFIWYHYCFYAWYDLVVAYNIVHELVNPSIWSRKWAFKYLTQHYQDNP